MLLLSKPLEIWYDFLRELGKEHCLVDQNCIGQCFYRLNPWKSGMISDGHEKISEKHHLACDLEFACGDLCHLCFNFLSKHIEIIHIADC